MALARALFLVSLALALVACKPARRPPPPVEQEQEVPPTPRVDSAFLRQALGPGLELANTPLVQDIDPRPGTEALVAVHRKGKGHEVALLRGNHQVLARAPLGGKILANAAIEAVGPFKEMDLWGDGGKSFLMPVDTLVYHRSVCGILAFRYRYNSLSLVGEFATKCWRKESGGDGGDPFASLKVDRQGKLLRIETVDDEGKRLYRWDPSQQAFLGN